MTRPNSARVRPAARRALCTSRPKWSTGLVVSAVIGVSLARGGRTARARGPGQQAGGVAGTVRTSGATERPRQRSTDYANLYRPVYTRVYAGLSNSLCVTLALCN